VTAEQTYAALLGAIARTPDERTVKCALVDWCKENDEFVRGEIAAALEEEPDLTLAGLHRPPPPPRSAEEHAAHARDRAAFARGRAALAAAVEPFARAVAWCASRRWAPRGRRPSSAERKAGLGLSAEWVSFDAHGAVLAAAISLRSWHWDAGGGSAVRKKRRPPRATRPAPPA
jgi:hypothetical protein